jgi:peptidoglycan hydrolase CwlO-like protein
MPVDEECVTPARSESVMVTLARMEGKLNRVFDRVDDLRPRVDNHDAEIGALKAKTQGLELGAKASVETATALAKALREAKETAEASARMEADKVTKAAQEEATKAALGWSPVTKVFAVLSAGLTLIVIYQSVFVK